MRVPGQERGVSGPALAAHSARHRRQAPGRLCIATPTIDAAPKARLHPEVFLSLEAPMPEPQPPAAPARARRVKLVAAACLLMFAVGAGAALMVLRSRQSPLQQSDTEVPLGVEQAVIIRYGGPRLQAQPYRRGASVSLRIANEVQRGRVRVYDIRYLISLPGDFDLTKYLTSTDGQPLADLPPFPVRGLTSLTKDIETRIQEIEQVGVHIGHWYYESLVGAGLFWVAWLLGLIFIGRPKRASAPPPAPRAPSLHEQIERLLAALAQRDLTTDEKAGLEALLLRHWRAQLGLDEQRMAAACRGMEASSVWGRAYRQLQAWLHNPRAGVRPQEFVQAYKSGTEPGIPCET